MAKYIPTTTRQWLNETTGQATGGGDGGDGSDPAFCLVPHLSYARNLIPSTNSSPWVAINNGRVTNNGKSYPGWNAANDKSGWVGKGTTYTIRLSQVANPSTTIHIVDAMVGVYPGNATTTYGGSMRGLQQDIRTDMFPDDAPSKVSPRHNGGFVALYGDGHTGFRKWGQSTPCDWVIQQATCN
jgi:prepilin-type processing-associated H-X9-DG protein